jgi:hypothetical protein
MRRREKTVIEGGKGAFEAIAGRRGGEGICGLEEKADEIARNTLQVKRSTKPIATFRIPSRAAFSDRWPDCESMRQDVSKRPHIP